MPTLEHCVVFPLWDPFWGDGITHFLPPTFSPLLTLPPPPHTHKHSQEMSQQYWPTQPNAKQLYGKNSVKLLSEEHSLGAKEIVVRKFDITDEKVCLHCACVGHPACTGVHTYAALT